MVVEPGVVQEFARLVVLGDGPSVLRAKALDLLVAAKVAEIEEERERMRVRIGEFDAKLERLDEELFYCVPLEYILDVEERERMREWIDEKEKEVDELRSKRKLLREELLGYGSSEVVDERGSDCLLKVDLGVLV